MNKFKNKKALLLFAVILPIMLFLLAMTSIESSINTYTADDVEQVNQEKTPNNIETEENKSIVDSSNKPTENKQVNNTPVPNTPVLSERTTSPEYELKSKCYEINQSYINKTFKAPEVGYYQYSNYDSAEMNRIGATQHNKQIQARNDYFRSIYGQYLQTFVSSGCNGVISVEKEPTYRSLVTVY